MADRMKGRPFLDRVGFALAGIRSSWLREASFRSQARTAFAAAVLLAVARPGPVWTALVAMSAPTVLALEAANAALEELADTTHPQHAPGIDRAKDMAAAAVLIASVGAAVVGCAAAYSVFS